MSTPFSSLRKHRHYPFRTGVPNLTPRSTRKLKPEDVPLDFSSSNEEINKLVNEVTSHMATENLRRRDVVEPDSNFVLSEPPIVEPSLSDHELMSVMMSKLGRMERRIKQLEFELDDKIRHEHVLKDKVRLLQRSQEASQRNPSRVQELEKKCLLLQQQVYEMENFLADYGLIWVGNTADSSDSESDDDVNPDHLSDKTSSTTHAKSANQSVLPHRRPGSSWRPSDSTNTVPDDFKVDYDRVVAAVAELNALAGTEEARVEHVADGRASGGGPMARLRRPDSVPLCLYANGIALFAGPFRPFTDASTRLVIQDITDGYFPSELETKYPEGVPFQVIDRREVYFKDRWSHRAFAGEGQRLGGVKDASKLVGQDGGDFVGGEISSGKSDDGSDNLSVTDVLPGHKLTVDQFLRQFPENVVREGRLIDVRSAIRSTIEGTDKSSTSGTSKSREQQGPILLETACVRELHERVESGRLAAAHSSASLTSQDQESRVTTLRVKSEQGLTTYILKLRFTETVSELVAYLDVARPHLAGKYDVVTTFPRCVLTDYSATMLDCGLVPNATLHLKRREDD